MITISLCMIVKNEEPTIARCLDSIKDLVDEIIVVDTGSTDRTKEIVKKYTSEIYDFEWVDNFSTARNYSFSKATKDFQLWLDADDVLLEEDRVKFRHLKENLDPRVDVVIMKYNIGGQDGNPVICTFSRERLVRRSKNFNWCDPVHEYIDFRGNFFNSDIAITHRKVQPRTRRNLDIFEKYIEKGNELSTRNWFYYARELYYDVQIDKAIDYYEKFLETRDGLFSNYLDSCIDLSACYKSKGDGDNELRILLKSFEFEPPRPEVVCQIGYYYKEKKDYSKAIDWFELASKLPKPQRTWGAVLHHYWDYVPYMELCSCYYYTGDLDQAIKYNQRAAEIRPDDPKVLHNRVFLATVKEALIKKRSETSSTGLQH